MPFTRMTSDDVVILREAGVNRQVIDYLMTTPMLSRLIRSGCMAAIRIGGDILRILWSMGAANWHGHHHR